MKLFHRRAQHFTACRQMAHHCIYCCACDHCQALRRIIDSAIFDPREHWQNRP